MANFRYLCLGALEEGITLEELVGVFKNYPPSTDVTTYKLEQLKTGEILYSLVSSAVLDFDEIERISYDLNLKVMPYFTYSDINESEVKQKIYFLCFNTKDPMSEMNLKFDRVMDALWNILDSPDAETETTFSCGYVLLTIFTNSRLSIETRDRIKKAINNIYPNSFVFEHPIETEENE